MHNEKTKSHSLDEKLPPSPEWHHAELCRRLEEVRTGRVRLLSKEEYRKLLTK